MGVKNPQDRALLYHLQYLGSEISAPSSRLGCALERKNTSLLVRNVSSKRDEAMANLDSCRAIGLPQTTRQVHQWI